MAHRLSIFNEVNKERNRQDEKFGYERRITNLLWNAILGEEVGEAAEATLDREFADPFEVAEFERKLRAELVQVAAVAVAWIEAIDDGRALTNVDRT